MPAHLDKFNTKLSSLTENIKQLRSSKSGRLPKDIWLKVVELNGYYLGIEIIPFIDSRKPVLKQRLDPLAVKSEIKWEGLLHIPGISISPGTPATELLPTLLRKEVLIPEKDGLSDVLSDSAVFWCLARYDIPERKTQAYSLIFTLNIGRLDNRFRSDLSVFDTSQTARVLPMHQPVIDRFLKGEKVPPFFDSNI